MFENFQRGPAWGFAGPRGRHNPHHQQQEEPNSWHKHEMRGRRHGPFGRGGPFGPGGHFDPESVGKRFFGRGDLKYALLELLQERPMHGYEMIKALEERSGGFYVPSPGSVYPTLQMLEDREFVTVSEDEGRKIYRITDTGRAFLGERQQDEEPWMRPPWGDTFEFDHRQFRHEIKEFQKEIQEVFQLFKRVGFSLIHNPNQLARLRRLLQNVRTELIQILKNEDPGEKK